MKNMSATGSTIWLLPIFGLRKQEWDNSGLINVYAADNRKDYGIPCVHVVFKALEQYAEPLEDIVTMMDGLVIEQYGYDKKVVVLALEIPAVFQEDYELILQGKYSQLSEEYRQMVSDKIEGELGKKTGGKRLQLAVIEKGDAIKDFIEQRFDLDLDHAEEYWENFDMEKETLTQQIINRL